MKSVLCLLACTIFCPSLRSVAQAPSTDSTMRYRNQDSLVLVQSGDTVSSGIKTLHYANSKPAAMGNLSHWVREGWWVIYEEDGMKSSEVYFQRGKGIHMRTFDSNGNVTGTTDSVEREAAFPGGDEGWSNYVRTALMAKLDYIAKKKGWGHLEVQFIVAKDGSVSDVSLTQSTGTVTDNIVTDIIRKSPRWIPAEQYNRRVKAYRKQKLALEPPKGAGI